MLPRPPPIRLTCRRRERPDPPTLPIAPGDPMPLDALVTGRIATLAGRAGFGWVEAIGIRAGRDRVRRLRDRTGDAGGSVHPTDRAGARRDRHPRPDRCPSAPGAGGVGPAPGRSLGGADARGGDAPGRRSARGRDGPRGLARRARLGRGPLASLADRERPGTGRPGTTRDALGARSPRPAREQRRAADRRGRRRRLRIRPAA